MLLLPVHHSTGASVRERRLSGYLCPLGNSSTLRACATARETSTNPTAFAELIIGKIDFCSGAIPASLSFFVARSTSSSIFASRRAFSSDRCTFARFTTARESSGNHAIGNLYLTPSFLHTSQNVGGGISESARSN